MQRIFLTLLERNDHAGTVTLAVLLKGSSDHTKDLMGFLTAQRMVCATVPSAHRAHVPEFAYFDDMFTVTLSPARWTFFELKRYIEAYVGSWDEPTLLREDLLEKVFACDEALAFGDADYVALSRQIDKCEDAYYEQRLSISLFLNGILKLLATNLQLEWAAAKLAGIEPALEPYICYYPASLSWKDVSARYDRVDERLVSIPIVFCGEHIAEFKLHVGPFSPTPAVVEQFAQYVIAMIDDFIYSDLVHKRQVYCLKCELAALRQEHEALTPVPSPEREEACRRNVRLAIIGQAHVGSGVILSECQHCGFAKSRVDLYVDYDKLRALDTNNLLKTRSHYDGLLLGPMPHRMRGTFSESCASLIEQMEHEPQRYPPFVVVRDHAHQLKITKASIHRALESMAEQLAHIDSYSLSLSESYPLRNDGLS